MIFLDDKPLTYYGLYLLRGHSHPSPTILNKTVKVPNRPGSYHFGNQIGDRPFNHPIGILQANPIETQRKLRNFIELLFDEYGQVREIKLRYDYEPDKYYTVRFDGSINPQRIFEYTEFQLPFVAYDPYAYSIVYADEVVWGSEVINFESAYTFGNEGTAGVTTVTSPTTLNAYIDGYAVKPIIEISGSATNLTVANGVQSFSFPSFTDASWVIDCERYTVTKNGVNAFNEVSLRDFWLFKGSNLIEIDGSNINITIRIKFRDRYL